MRPRTPDSEKVADLNMTPMIDVVFQLLIFFMLSMHFKDVEGKLILALPPWGHGPGPAAVMLEEVHITLCAGGDVREHTSDKGAHEKKIKDGTVTHLRVENMDIGALEQGQGKALYRAAARQAREMGIQVARPRTVIDADSEVPYEHVLGIVNALKEVGIESIEFAANPRFVK